MSTRFSQPFDAFSRLTRSRFPARRWGYLGSFGLVVSHQRAVLTKATMLTLSQTTGYAILALGCLNGCRGRLILAREIAASTGTPLPYLSKLLHALCRQGLIEGKRGYRGGFVLARPAEQISLLEVAEAVEGQAWLPHCLLGLAECSPQQVCPAHEFWAVERQKIKDKLRETTVADIAAFARQRGLVGLRDYFRTPPENSH